MTIDTGVRPEFPHDNALDGLRAIAVGLVLLVHAVPWLVPGGWVGVDVFFVLSGFLITTILRREIASSGRVHYRAFYIRRTLRLAPALLLFLMVGLMLAALRGADTFREASIAALFAATYTMNWNLAFGWGPSWLFTHTWSLAIEEQFYLLWPLVLFCVIRRKPVYWLLGALVLVLLWRTSLVLDGATTMRTYTGFDTHADGLLVGCLLAFASVPRAIERLLPVFAALGVVALAAICVALPFDSPWTSLIGIPVASLASGALLLQSRRDGWFRTLLVRAPLVYLGRISYGIYLWHVLTLTIGQAIFPGWGAVLGALVSIPIAAASFEMYEKRFLRLKARLAPRV